MQLFEFIDTFRLDLLLRLILAAVLGGVIGLERELSGKPAGFRTNLLICVGAALFTEMSMTLPIRAGLGGGDPSRITAQIVSGIGFLGAGTIIQARGSVTGLTTAATLWVVSAIGVAAGASAYMEAIGTTVLVMLALVGLGRVERMIVRLRRVERRLAVEMDGGADDLERLRLALRDAGLGIETLDVSKEAGGLSVLVVATGRGDQWSEAKRRLIGIEGVHKVAGL